MRGWMEALVMKKVAPTITAIWIGLLLNSATSVVDGRVEARDMEGLYAVDAGRAKKCWNRGQETRPGAPRVVTMSGRITESQARKILARRAREVLLAIKNRDMTKLATFGSAQQRGSVLDIRERQRGNRPRVHPKPDQESVRKQPAVFVRNGGRNR